MCGQHPVHKIGIHHLSQHRNPFHTIARMIRPLSRIRPIHPTNRAKIQCIGLRYSSGHAPVYKPPTGYMFNEKVPTNDPPLPPSLRIDETNVIASETGQETSKGRLGTVYVGLLWSLCIRRRSQCNEYGLYVPHSASMDRCLFLGSKIGP